MAVKKLSIALPPDVAAEVAAAADRNAESVSAWLDRAARTALRRDAGLSAMEEYEREHGAFTEEELAEADRVIDSHFGPEVSD